MASGEEGEKLIASLERAVPMRRLGEPEDVGAAVAFLASERAGYITALSQLIQSRMDEWAGVISSDAPLERANAWNYGSRSRFRSTIVFIWALSCSIVAPAFSLAIIELNSLTRP